MNLYVVPFQGAVNARPLHDRSLNFGLKTKRGLKNSTHRWFLDFGRFFLRGCSLKTAMEFGFECSRGSIAGHVRSGSLLEVGSWPEAPELRGYP
jgi:hypothetical protein